MEALRKLTRSWRNSAQPSPDQNTMNNELKQSQRAQTVEQMQLPVPEQEPCELQVPNEVQNVQLGPQ